MKIVLIVIAIIVIAILIKACKPKGKSAEDTLRPPDAIAPSVTRANDKIIIVDHVDKEDIRTVLVQLCNIYNKNQYLALPRLWQLSSTSFAITFLYDIDFATYCFAVNYLKYPMDIKWQSKVRAWATTKKDDDWVTDKTLGKQVMLFLAIDDKEYDNVFLTTKDNIGYKLGFASGQQSQLLSEPKEQYINPSISINSLNGKAYEDFK